MLLSTYDDYLRSVGAPFSPETQALVDVLKQHVEVAALTPAEYLSIADRQTRFPHLVLHDTSNPPRSEFSAPDFLAGLKTHMEGGGKVFLSGTAPKVLDLAGITPELFAIRSASATFYVRNADHPITVGVYTLNQALSVNSAAEAYLVSPVPTTLGIQLLGQSSPSSYQWSLAEVPYGAGKAVVLGAAAYLTPNAALATMTYRCLDYLATTQLADLKLEATLAPSVVQNNGVELTAVVTAYGGGSTLGIQPSLTLPGGATVTRLRVDGSDVPPQADYAFSRMNSGESHTLVWTLALATPGSTSVPIQASYYSSNARSVSTTRSIYVAVNGQDVTGKIALIGGATALDLADLTEIERLLELTGWVVDRRTVGEMLGGLINPAEYDVTALHYTSADASTLPTLTIGLPDYLNAGGMVMLSGTAGEILDKANITTNAVAIRSADGWVRIKTISHPITDSGYTVNQQVRVNDDHVDVAYLTDPTTLALTSTLIGESPNSSNADVKNSFAELRYGNGRILMLGPARFTTNTPRDDLHFLLARSIDYLKRTSSASLTVTSGGAYHTIGTPLRFNATVRDIFKQPVPGAILEGVLTRADLTTVPVTFAPSDAAGASVGEVATTLADPGGFWRLRVEASLGGQTIGQADVNLFLSATLSTDGLIVSAAAAPPVVGLGMPFTVSGVVHRLADSTPADADVLVQLIDGALNVVASGAAPTNAAGEYTIGLTAPGAAGLYTLRVSATDRAHSSVQGMVAAQYQIGPIDPLWEHVRPTSPATSSRTSSGGTPPEATSGCGQWMAGRARQRPTCARWRNPDGKSAGWATRRATGGRTSCGATPQQGCCTCGR